MISATTGKEPDHIQDEDLRTPDQLRGDMKDIVAAKLSIREKATVEGVLTELSVVKQQLEMTHEQLRRLIGMYQTLQGEFTQFKGQRIKELNVRVNGGPTSPEDM
ncbi:hypothetical protein KAR91_51995 [Candidatus Pacearchaeota archaeon]|nr:hypothetical protein [Candidatus Pacearchaeota archaeon]